MEAAGVTVKGKNHSVNQDSFLLKETEDITILAVSDGLGSLEFSDKGSSILCEVLCQLIDEKEIYVEDMAAMAKLVHERWINLLNAREIDISKSYATCLICILKENTAYIFRLGDGIICMRADQEIKVFFDKKEDRFYNETVCLSELFDADEWEFFQWEYDDLEGIVLCSDGVDIFCDGMSQEEAVTLFADDFFNAYGSQPVETSQKEILGWLSEWKSSDDKTLVYLVKGVCCKDD